MSLFNDLDDYKLHTEFCTNPNILLHRSYRADRARGRQRIAIQEEWAPQKPPLGVGQFGVVRLEQRQKVYGDTSSEHQELAVKQLRKIDLDRMRVDFRKELQALTKFSRLKFAQSQAFVKFFGWFEDDDHVYLAMEYFRNGTLDHFIAKGLLEQDAQIIGQQLLEGLKIMHQEQFTHRDLKPQNIFVVQQSPYWWVKIGDLGISKRAAKDDTVLRTSTGTPLYLAPEVFHYLPFQDEETDTYTNAVDIWSFACVLYEMLALQVPFTDWPRDLVAFCHGAPFPDGPLMDRVSTIAIDFVKSVLVPTPEKRPTAQEAFGAE
ncbi:uncharacterized protein TRUGW13939_10417 [Talaromyces rugulosus]|uniref:Serine/threonine-protein kinase ATG1 n=1 Tax=Talaromyces rugulosus TaxID=121627 RepID=A0A7H8RB65_TALRU|nr:uncharacterized protein TRUGW13939_10417 [Talaromyces rugulosus]QKX63248.1 hypothetical protein TRUGW13939_10417 [Talaromyces rugulosus]